MNEEDYALVIIGFFLLLVIFFSIGFSLTLVLNFELSLKLIGSFLLALSIWILYILLRDLIHLWNLKQNRR
mgnify:CR=1 FL=1